MRSKLLSLALVAMFMVSVVGTTFAASPVEVVQSPFIDLADDAPTAKAFALLNAAGIFEGYGDATVRPNNTLTRAEFSKVVISMLNRKSTADALSTMTPQFTDAAAIPVWARGWVNAAHAIGVIQGRADGTFDPAAPVTFAEAVTMLVRALGYEAAVVGPWPAAHIAMGADIGITDGLTIFFQVPITREEMAIMTHNALFTVPADKDGVEDEDKEDLIKERFDYKEVEGFKVADESFGAMVALFGANTLNDVDGTTVDRLKRGGNVVFIDADVDKTTGKWTAYSSASRRITVGGTRYDLADDEDVQVVINAADFDWLAEDHPFDDAVVGAKAGTFAAVFEVLEDEEVTLTFDDGEVVKIEAWLDTYEDAFLEDVDVEDDEEDFGSITIEGNEIEVDDDTKIWLNGERVTFAELEEAFDDFQDDWTSFVLNSDDAEPITTVQTEGSDHTDGALALNVWVWTDNLVSGEVTGRGSDFIRVDGEKFDITTAARAGTTLGDEFTFLLNSKDKIVDILDEVVVEDIYFAKLLEMRADDEFVVELADGTEVALTDVEDNTDVGADELLGLVVVVTEGFTATGPLSGTAIHDVQTAESAGAIDLQFGMYRESTASWIRLQEGAGVFPWADDVFFYDPEADKYINRGDLDENDSLMLGLIDDVVGYVELTAFIDGVVLNITQGKQYDTIGEAVDDANPSDRLLVGAGTYEESVTVDVEGLEIIGAGANLVTVDADGDNGFNIEADNVTISDVEILNADYGVFVDQSEDGGYDGITLSRNRIEGAYYGIYFGNECEGGGYGGSATIRGNTIIDSDEIGIRVYVHDAGGHVIIISDNYVEGSDEYGIRVQAACGGSEIDEVRITGNTVVDGGPGIRVHASRGDNGEDGYDGALIKSVIIAGNTLRDNDGEGIRVHSGTRSDAEDGVIENVTVTGNTVTDPGGNGIRVHLHGEGEVTESVSVTGNTVTRGEKAGIRVHIANGLTAKDIDIRDNVVTAHFQADDCDNNGAPGIRVHAGRDTTIESLTIDGNTIQDGLGQAIRVHAGQRSTIEYVEVNENVVTNNASLGIRISVCARNDSDGADGDDAGAILEVSITDNTVTDNRIGIYLYSGDSDRDRPTDLYGGLLENITVEGNVLEDNDTAIHVEANNNGRIDGVVIQGNTLIDNTTDLEVVEEDGGEVLNLTSDITT